MRSLTRRALLHDKPPAAALCRSCLLLRRRQFVTDAAPPRPPVSGLAQLPSRRVLAIAGPDAAKFLQGIVTNNVASEKGQPREQAFYAGFLNATGRVVHDTFIYPLTSGGFGGIPADGEGFLIEADAAQMTRFEKYIKRYKLRAKFTVKSLAPEEVSVWQAWNDGGDLSPTANEHNVVLRDPRAPSMGHRILHIGQGAPEADVDRSDEDAYTIRRYLQGVPEGQDELLRETALPLESNMELMGGIDFHKGCYVGQELTIRTKHRGVVRKRILPCMIYDVDRPAPQALAYEPESASPQTLTAAMVPTETSIGRFGKRGRSAGKWMKGVGNIGLGLCRLEIMTDVVLPGEQAAATYSPEDECVLEWGKEERDGKSAVKVKAFVPDWLRAGIDQGGK